MAARIELQTIHLAALSLATIKYEIGCAQKEVSFAHFFL